MIDKIIFFDLGDTLLYRTKPLLEYDVDLIASITRLKRSEINKIVGDYKDVYTFKEDVKTTLKAEDRYFNDIFYNVFNMLSRLDLLTDFLELRLKQSRYSLFPNTLDYLEKLSNQFELGIITNGRPSRRRVIKQLGLDKFFKENNIYISDELGISKPNKKISHCISDISNYQLIYLVDDEYNNIRMAEELGWKGILINHKQNGYQVLDEIVKCSN